MPTVQHFVDWSTGAQWPWSWIIFIVMLVIGVVLNTFIFIVINYKKELRDLRMSLLIRYLSVDDFLINFFCLISCSVNIHNLRYVGEQSSCNWQGFYACFYFVTSGLTMTLISFESYRSICDSQTIQNSTIHKCQILILLYGALIATLTTVWPKHAKLVSTGTYCLPAFNEPVVWVLFVGFGILSPLLVLTFFYWRIYQKIDEMKKTLHDVGMDDHSPKRKQVHIARMMSWYLITYLLTASGLLVASIIELVSDIENTDPGWYHYGGYFAHFNGVIDPLLFFWLNREARSTLKEMLSCRRSTRDVKQFGDMTQRTEDLQKTLSQLIMDGTETTEHFREYLVEQYAEENFDFILHVCQWEDIIQREGIKSDECWDKAQYIYNIFLNAPSAPLEVNVSYESRKKVTKMLSEWNELRKTPEDSQVLLDEWGRFELVFQKTYFEICEMIGDSHRRFADLEASRYCV